MRKYRVKVRLEDGSEETHEVEAETPPAARAAMEEQGFEVVEVRRVWPVEDQHPEPVRARAPARTAAEMTPNDFGWLITKHVVIALAIWFVIGLVISLVLAAVFRVPFTVNT